MLKDKDFEINERQPSFYTILPAFIRYCKELSYFEMILYSEIVARTNKKGFCWTSNKTFCELYNCSERTITRTIKKLLDLKFLKCYFSNYKGKVYRVLEINAIDKKKEQEEAKNYKSSNSKKIVPVPSWYDDYLEEMKIKAEEDKNINRVSDLSISDIAKDLFTD